jgi:ubiquinone/menaquinone biosynthesis C-methylase UbiE
MNKIVKILTKILVDPYDNSDLIFKYTKDGKFLNIVNRSLHSYQINDGVIDFTNNDNSINYVSSFGYQWVKAPKMQLDSFNGTTISKDRFFSALNISSKKLKGKLILDVGCGTGRFAEIALKSGAIVVGLDYSEAAYVCASNLKYEENFISVRGDIYNLPFRKNSFDIVYCLGVLQHTPNVEKAFKMLPPVVKKSGYLVVDYYWKRLKTVAGWKYIIRIITTKLSIKSVDKILKILHPIIYPMSCLLANIPFIGKYLIRFLPILNYSNNYPQLNRELLKAWSILDTFDAWASRFDSPQTVKSIVRWAKQVNLKNITVEHVGQLVLRGKVK